MPLYTASPVLTVDPSTIDAIDPRIPENLFGMWSAFSKCSGILEEGKRMENLSWRLWQREFLSKRKARHSHRHTFTRLPAAATAPPALSSSVGSTISSCPSDELEDPTPDSSPASTVSCAKIRAFPHPTTADSTTATPLDLKNLVISIKERQDLTEPIPALSSYRPHPSLSSPRHLYKPTPVRVHHVAPAQDTTPRPSSPLTAISPASTAQFPAHPTAPMPVQMPSSIAMVDTAQSVTSPTDSTSTSATSNASGGRHSTVRGFDLGRSSSYRSQTQLAPLPQPTSILKPPSGDRSQVKKRAGMFLLGSSSGSGDDEGQFQRNMKLRGMKQALTGAMGQSADTKKQTSFDENVTEIRVNMRPDDNEQVFEDTDEDEDEENEESAIDDDDDYDDDDDAWENASDDGDSGASSEANTTMFQRVASTSNLTTRPSLLTLALNHEGQRMHGLQNAASRSTPHIRRSRTSTPNGPSVAASPDAEPAMHLPIRARQRTPSLSAAMSPKTTRRTMLSTELPDDLRRDLLWERKQRPQPLQHALPRRHTSQDVASLRAYPPGDAASTLQTPTAANYTFENGYGEYNTSGW